MAHHILKVHPSDDIIVALADLNSGTELDYEGESFQLVEDIPIKHKFAARDFATGDHIHMYGVLVGTATRAIPKGGLVSTQNVRHSSDEYAIGERKLDWIKPDVSRWESTTFMGYHRSDGRVGTANYWLVIPLVFCENRNVRVMQEILEDALGYGSNKSYDLDLKTLMRMQQEGASHEELLAADIRRTAETSRQNRFFPNVDGIKFLTHEGGCGGTRQDSEMLCRILAGYITHPNVAGSNSPQPWLSECPGQRSSGRDRPDCSEF